MIRGSRARVAVALGTTWLAGLALAAACTFPSPALVDVPGRDAGGPGEASPDGTTGPDGGSPDDGGVDVVPVFDGDLPPPDASALDGDAAIVTQDGAVINCDEDGDRFAKIGGSCGGLDCDDTNSNVRPNQDYTTLTPLPGTGPGRGGDWNCNGEIEVFGNRGVNPACGGTTATGCVVEGYVADAPACGGTSRYVKCTANGLFCAKTFDQPLPVSCR